VVGDWLEQALTTFSEINAIVTSDLKVAQDLVSFARRLPDDFREQRDYLLKHQERLQETGMAGAEWNLSPSTSREFIRQTKLRKGAIPGVPQRWWDPASRVAGSDEEE